MLTLFLLAQFLGFYSPSLYIYKFPSICCRKLFWSDWNRAQPKIEWSTLDGSDRSIFASGPNVQLPNSVTIDTSNDELCWADAGIKRIMCMGIETRATRMIPANCISPFGLTVSSTRYFWTEKSM